MDAFPQYDSYAFVTCTETPPSRCLHSSNTASNDLSAKELSLTLKNTSSWTYCGALLAPKESVLPPSLHKWASVTVSQPDVLFGCLLPLLSFLRRFLLEAGIEHYWLTIRATQLTHEYDIARWHVDDDFFAPGFGRLIPEHGFDDAGGVKTRGWKLATTLLGPPTLFLKDNASALDVLRNTKAQQLKSHQHECTSIRCLGCSTYADSIRQSLATSLRCHAVASPGPGELAFFRLGDCEGAVHSEPKCDTDRIFLNVVPGSEDQLRELMGRWGMQFPRAWCLGVPGGAVPSDEREACVKCE